VNGDEVSKESREEELVRKYAKRRGFMGSSGIPDSSRAARVILKDYVKGKLLYCSPPLGMEKEFKQWNEENSGETPHALSNKLKQLNKEKKENQLANDNNNNKHVDDDHLLPKKRGRR